MKFLTKILTVLAAVAISSSSVVRSSDGNFELLILHNNDMHARFEQTSQHSGSCTKADREAKKCYGGFARVAHVVKEARAAAKSGAGPPVLYLNAGDTYTGTAWFTIYKWRIAAEFINALQPDAVSLGNHEFDEAIEGLIPFIRNVTTPVLAANLILNKVPELQNESNLHRSIIIIKNGVKIGIIGYLTPQTKYLVFKNDVEYEDEVIALKREVKQLKHKGVNILIALGHSGFEEDLIIAKEVEDIDLVIGGHSNTFLWNDIVTDEITEPISGPYPTVVRQASGRLVRVVQAYAYTKYLGKLHLIFDSDGEIIECDGTPLLLDQEVPRDPELMKIVNKYRVEVERISNEVVGSSQVFLDGKTCRLQECNLGDLITTAMLNYTQENHLSNVNIAIIAGGRIRSSISHPQTPFSLTRGEWMTVLPFSDVLTIVTMNGSTLREGLEHSVSEWNPVDSKGQFLQFSGIEVVYDLEKPPGSRVVKAKAVCSNCGQFKPVDVKDYYEYEVLMPSFLAQRGDGFTMFDGLPDWPLTYNELECVLYYVNKYSPINQTRNGRITLLNEDKARKRFSYDARNAPSSSIRVFNTKAKYVVWVAALLLIRNI
ncbi:hypothetical protein O3G_MSEX009026 [Manduca sexta]|uniref:Protein 5NUC n=1 Tax=Manduca sexta TaxID=7130 RepID=A0A921ZE17_MANSE|nr:hypothetical protein O3G_MSEX009026 [Manduca sexta]